MRENLQGQLIWRMMLLTHGLVEGASSMHFYVVFPEGTEATIDSEDYLTTH
jgi:hypothetical protein